MAHRGIRKAVRKRTSIDGKASKNSAAMLQAGLRQQSLGNVKEALVCYERVLRKQPLNADALHLKCQALIQLEDYKKALQFLYRCSCLPELSGKYRYNIAYGYYQMKRFRQAADHLRLVLDVEPNHLLARLLLTRLYLDRQSETQAAELLEPVDFTGVTSPADKMTSANVLMAASKDRLAGFMLNDLLSRKQLEAECLYEFAKLPSQHWPEDFSQLILKQLKQSKPNSPQRSMMHFAKGRLAHQAKQFDDAYKHFVAAKNVALPEFDMSSFEQAVFQLQHIFADRIDSSQQQQSLQPSTGCQPVFVVGLPQSGKSLTEAVIAAHPDVAACGEISLPFFIHKDIFVSPDGRGVERLAAQVSRLKKPELAKMQSDYTEGVVSDILMGNRLPFFINTMPHNHLNIGILKLVMPSSLFVFVERDLEDNYVSCLMKFFGQKHAYLRNIRVFQEYSLLHKQLMSHWRMIAGASIRTIRYEDLVHDPKTVARELWQFIGASEEGRDQAERNLRDIRIVPSHLGLSKGYKKHIERDLGGEA